MSENDENEGDDRKWHQKHPIITTILVLWFGVALIRYLFFDLG